MKRSQRGITLIALVITIIVLLILAGVSVSMVVGDNGVLNQASKAKLETEIATEKEMVGLAYSALKADVLAGNTVKIDADLLEQAINKQYNSEMVTVTETVSTLIVKFNDSGREYILDNEGGFLETLPIEDILATAEKHPDQTLTNDIGVAEDGTLVNLDLWDYTLESDNTYSLGSGYYSGYDNDEEVLKNTGKINGKVPMYIKEEGQEFYTVTNVSFGFCDNLKVAPEIPSSVTNLYCTFYGCSNLTTVLEIKDSVNSMNFTFYDCTNLIEIPSFPEGLKSLNGVFNGCEKLVDIPDIPFGVTNMNGTFTGCTSLKQAPEIPSSVTDMSRTFKDCINLTTEPVIPDGVIILEYTFENCSSLTEAPEIPSSVTRMISTFRGCTNLTGTLKINASLTSNYSECFLNASTAEGTSLVLVGNGSNDETITNLYNTKSENSNITIGSGT